MVATEIFNWGLVTE
jgi:hypothetical protein